MWVFLLLLFVCFLFFYNETLFIDPLTRFSGGLLCVFCLFVVCLFYGVCYVCVFYFLIMKLVY